MFSSRNAAVAAPVVQLRPEILRVPVWLRVSSLPFLGLFRLLRWLFRTPLVLALVLHFAALVAAGVAWGDAATLAVFTGSLVLVTVGAATWNRLRPESFRRYAVAVLRGEWRRMTHYRRIWADALETYKLTRTRRDKLQVPRLMWVTSSGPIDRLRVKLLRGQLVTEWIEQAPHLAQFFDVEKIRVVSVYGKTNRRQRQLVDVIAMRRDVLVNDVPPIEHELDLDQADNVDLKALPVALSEDGWVWKLRLLGNHLLIAGETGAGKGSVIWSIMKALGPAIRSGRVHVHGLDPKAIELTFGGSLFRRLVTPLGNDDPSDVYIEMLTELRDTMRARLQSMQGRSRLLVPSPEEPLHVILIDELAAVVAYVADRKKAEQINTLLGEILTQGRAPGVLVIAALQEPLKETVKLRGLFSVRIALRLAQANYVDMALGEGARANGAECDRIDQRTPGIAYVIIEGREEPGRVRFPYIDDDELRDLAHLYRPGSVAEVYPFPQATDTAA